MDFGITATLGPASQSEKKWNELISSGATAFRLNTSHLSLEELNSWLNKLNEFFSLNSIFMPVILDLQGSKWRLGEFPEFDLHTGMSLRLVPGIKTESANTLPVPHSDFFRAAEGYSGNLILNDGKTVLRITDSEPGGITAEVISGGRISGRKGITFASEDYRNETLGDKDSQIIALIDEPGNEAFRSFIRYAISYVRDSSHMKIYRKLFSEGTYLIAKLERESAVLDAEKIAMASDELWICRGDLGAEAGLVRMAECVYELTQKIPEIKVPVFMAGQVLEHMTSHPAPTRSEVCYIYDCLMKGCRGFVLSDETATGSYPAEACSILSSFRNEPATGR